MSESPPVADFLETLPVRGRVLVRRLESFGDIVVGFSISQLALQLGYPRHPADLTAHPIRYLIFFVTFAIIAIAWLRFHRMLTLAFAPGRIDLTCAFAYLAFTALLPYAMYANSELASDPMGARYGLAAYAICLVGSSSSAFFLSFRSIGRARGVLSLADFGRLQQRTYIEGSIALAFALVLASDVFFGPQWSWLFTSFIPISVSIIRRRFKAPSWSAVHVYGVDE
jgi:uncharacterized membrane protein